MLEKIVVQINKNKFVKNHSGLEKKLNKFIVFWDNVATGNLPSNEQLKYAEKYGISSAKLTNYSVYCSLIYTAVKVSAGILIRRPDSLGQVGDYVGTVLQGLGAYGVIEAFVRLGYTMKTKKPIGLFYLEAIDRLEKFIFSKNPELEIKKHHLKMICQEKNMSNRINYFQGNLAISFGLQ